MEKTYSSVELQPVEYRQQDNGKAIVLLRANIEQGTGYNDDGTSFDLWEADEVMVVTDLAEDEIMENFDDLWSLGEEQAYRRSRMEMRDEDWRADIDAALLDIMEVMA